MISGDMFMQYLSSNAGKTANDPLIEKSKKSSENQLKTVLEESSYSHHSASLGNQDDQISQIPISQNKNPGIESYSNLFKENEN